MNLALYIHKKNKKSQTLQTLISMTFLEKYFNDWSKILLDKDEKEKMDKFAVISRDDLSRRKVADEMKMMADKQAKYESQLKKMGIPVIVGLVICNNQLSQSSDSSVLSVVH